MIRKVLVLSIPMLLLLVVALASAGPSTINPAFNPSGAASTVASVPAPGCAHCITDRNACQAACGGNPECLAICQSEYECCLIMCHGGSCRTSESTDLIATNFAQVSNDDFESTANCQACEDNAAAMRADCEAVYGEGDADCRHQSESYRISCQNEWCN